MKKYKVIHPKYLPKVWPVQSTAISYLLLDRFHAPEFLWGAVGFMVILTWILVGLTKSNEEKIDLDKAHP